MMILNIDARKYMRALEMEDKVYSCYTLSVNARSTFEAGPFRSTTDCRCTVQLQYIEVLCPMFMTIIVFFHCRNVTTYKTVGHLDF